MRGAEAWAGWTERRICGAHNWEGVCGGVDLALETSAAV
jgi:hypothetical protein